MSVFVQMTSFKNFDVLPTIKDCIAKAKDKDNLFFGLCLQQDDDVPKELNHPRIKISKSPLAERHGPGWARSQAQSFYSGQDYTLQVDAGSRFLENWDEELINSLNSTGSQKAIITNSPNRYIPASDTKEHPTCSYKPHIHQFVFDNPLAWPSPMKNIKNIVTGRWIVDSFFFTRGQHCLDCKYNPNLYYSESESANTLKSFTSGYDIFHHFKPVVWRIYDPRPVQWTEDADWWVKDFESKKILSNLIKGEGLGRERTVRDFELYSGVDFVNRRLQKNTIVATDPPCKYENEEQWNKEYMKDYAIAATWNVDEIEKCEDLDYWFFAIEDANDQVINRQDLRFDRDADILNFKINYKKIMFKAAGGLVPAKIVIQPVSKSKGWLTKSKFSLS